MSSILFLPLNCMRGHFTLNLETYMIIIIIVNEKYALWCSLVKEKKSKRAHIILNLQKKI